MQGAILKGLTVIDATQNVAGPFCTQILGDLGATIVKIERPAGGDDTRAWTPPSVAGRSSTFLALNRNKSSLAVDLDSADGQRIIRELVGEADIFVHSMKPGSLEKRGLGWDELSAVNPALIYCAISAFGADGPMAHLPGYDPLMQAFTGIMSTTGNEGDAPVRVGVSIIDMGTGMWAAIGILSALRSRDADGKGIRVDASLLDTGIGWMSVFVSNFAASGAVPRKLGSAMAMTAPYEIFPAADGSVFIAAGNDRLFAKVCAGLGAPGLAQDPRFRTNPDRVNNRPALRDALGALTGGRSVSDIVATLRRVGAPCSELNNVAQMLSAPQVAAAGIVRSLPICADADHRVVALPFKINGERGTSFGPPPDLGAHSAAILSGLGYRPEEIEALRRAGTIA